MRTELLIAALCFSANAMGAIIVNGLDPEHEVRVETVSDNGSTVVSFEGQNYTLDENTIYLDGELTDLQAASSTYIYNNVREALSAINVGSKATAPKRILIAPSVYWVDDPDDPNVRTAEPGSSPYGMIIECPSISLIGLTDTPENVVLACNRGQTQGSVGNFTMLNLLSNEVYTSNITFGNYCNVDLVYPLKEKYNRSKRRDAIVQAQLVHTTADKIFADNCSFISRLNCNPITGGRRTLYTNCYFECTDDALASSSVYLNCHFTFFSQKPFYSTEHYGAVLLDCDIDTHVTDNQYFTKADGGITIIDTRFKTLDSQSVNIQFNYAPRSDSWYESNVSLNGNPINISGGIDITDKYILNAYKVTINGETVYNIANLMAGDDGWDPLNQKEIIPEEYIGIPTHMLLTGSWEKDVVINRWFTNHVYENLSPDGEKASVEATFYRWGGYKATETEIQKVAIGGMLWKRPTLTKLTPTGNFTADITTASRVSNLYEGDVTASLSSGLQGKTKIYINPYLYDAPGFEGNVTIDFDKASNSLMVGYKLTPDASGVQKPKDRSLITWYRYTQEDLSDTIAVLYGADYVQTKQYKLTNADKDAHFLVTVTPRYEDTQSGETKYAKFEKPVKNMLFSALFTQESHYLTDFHNVPVRYQPRVVAGTWTFDAYKPEDTAAQDWEAQPKNAWYYGTGEDGCKGKGLNELTKGARCFYMPARETCDEMKVTVKIDPGKTVGQGFGSATDQYLDIYIKFDPQTLTGYALRIERTPDYDKACSFQLVKYVKGKVIRLGKPVISNCYISTCTVNIQIKGNDLTATATSNATLQKPSKPEIKTEVYLEASVAKNEFCGFGLQHTGSTGASASMIHTVELDWK